MRESDKMKIKKSRARDLLPKKSQSLFDDITEQRVLGASKHIVMIGDMIQAIAEEGERRSRSIEDIIDDVLTVTQFFIETRGEANQAINNAIDIMIKGIAKVKKLEYQVAIDHIIKQKDSYLHGANRNFKHVITFATDLVKPMQTIMVFDYSSTVNAFLKKARVNEEDLTVIIPESRSIDGGHGFVQTCHNAGHHVTFIPDAAIMYFLKECDAAFMGVETFFPDGTAFNTTGSDIVGLVCKTFHIPLYILTPLIKVDVRPVYGYKKVLVKNDLRERLTAHWDGENKDKTDFICPELLGVDPCYITAYITEQGIIPAKQLFNISMDYYSKLKGAGQ